MTLNLEFPYFLFSLWQLKCFFYQATKCWSNVVVCLFLIYYIIIALNSNVKKFLFHKNTFMVKLITGFSFLVQSSNPPKKIKKISPELTPLFLANPNNQIQIEPNPNLM